MTEEKPEVDRPVAVAVVFELRRLNNRWTQPMGGEVISTHPSQGAALAAYDREPQAATDGGGRSSMGSFVPNVVIRVEPDGTESVAMIRPGVGGYTSPGVKAVPRTTPGAKAVSTDAAPAPAAAPTENAPTD